MAQFWSDQQVTLSIGNKTSANTGVSYVDIVGLNGISCGSTILDESSATAGTDLSNTDTFLTTPTAVKFYLSPTDMTKTSATGDVQVRLKWKGLDHTSNTSDDTWSPYYTINNVEVLNAVDSISTSFGLRIIDPVDNIELTWELRGENHNGTFLPVYSSLVNLSVIKNRQQISSTTTRNNSYTFSADSTGQYFIVICAEGSYKKPTVSACVAVEERYYRLGRGVLGTNILK